MNQPDGTFVIGVDIGGTFTDCTVVGPDGSSATGKVPTTPHDRSIGFFGSVEEAAASFGSSLAELLRRSRRIVHGTTTGVNALVSRTGAEVGLVTTAGHGDVLLMMKGAGRTAGLPPDLLLDEVATRHKPEPFVGRALTIEIEERIDFEGDVVVPMDDERAEAAVRPLLDRVEALAISFLWSVQNPVHEHRMREIVRRIRPDLFVTCGSDIVSRIGEYERAVTCVFNAYIGPLMVQYVTQIEERARELGFGGSVLFAQSAGGAISADEVRRSPILTMQSGPVSGVMRSSVFGAQMGEAKIITADMGGTTFDVSVLPGGEPLMRDSNVFEQFEMALPMLDIESIGAGGGSIAWVDESGRLDVGPASAGSDPGPACYGRGGTDATVTDADVVLGIIDPEMFLHGEFTIDPKLAHEAIERLGDRIGLDAHATAAGINRIVDSKMADLLRRMTEFRGLDPRQFTLLAFGGGGPVHAAACASAAGVRRVIVPSPVLAPVWSAAGAALLDIVHVYQRPANVALPTSDEEIEAAFAEMEMNAAKQLARYGLATQDHEIARSVRMRYDAQIYDVEVPCDAGGRGMVDTLMSRFRAVYEERFGRHSGLTGARQLVTAFQVRATVTADHGQALVDAPVVTPERLRRQVYWHGSAGFLDTPVLRFSSDAAGRIDDVIEGPALVEFANTVVVVRPGDRATFDRFGNVVVQL